MPNVAMSRGYGWRGGCSAAAVTGADVGSVGWFGSSSPLQSFEKT